MNATAHARLARFSLTGAVQATRRLCCSQIASFPPRDASARRLGLLAVVVGGLRRMYITQPRSVRSGAMLSAQVDKSAQHRMPPQSSVEGRADLPPTVTIAATVAAAIAAATVAATLAAAIAAAIAAAVATPVDPVAGPGPGFPRVRRGEVTKILLSVIASP